ncbi:unnamed protein product, partial [Dovyalis caffra]
HFISLQVLSVYASVYEKSGKVLQQLWCKGLLEKHCLEKLVGRSINETVEKHVAFARKLRDYLEGPFRNLLKSPALPCP